MSERPKNPHDEQPTSQGGWHSPGEASPWQSPDTQTAATVAWREVKALPEDVEKEPEERGMWHLPEESDTTFNPDDVVEVSDAPRPTPTTSTVPVASPEDLLAEILGGSQKTASVPRPEDFDYSTTGDEEPTAAADALEAGETLLVDEEELTSDAEPLLEFDADDEAFSMSEYMALANLAQGDDDDIAGLNASDLSPAEQAAYSAALNVANEMDSKQQQQLQEPSVPDDATVTMDDTNEQPASQAAEYAARQLAELGQSDAGGTEQFTQQQPQQPQYTPEEIQLAQQFRETKRQVAILRQRQQQGQIDPNQLQAELQNYQIYDPQGNWWMVGYETDNWYRFNNMTQQWEEAQPPVPLDAGQARTETGLGEAAPDIMTGSLPYLPSDGSGAQEFSDQDTLYDDYDNTQYSQSQQSYNEQYPVDQSPIRYPNQPTNDPNLTVVGNSYDATQLNMGTDPTYQNMPAVDPNATVPSDPMATVPSSSANLGDLIYSDDPYGQGIPAADQRPVDTGHSDYGAQDVATPDYDALAGRQRDNTITYVLIAVVGVVIIGLSVVGGFFLWAQMTYTSIIEEWQDEIAALGTEGFDFQTATILAADGSVIAELTGEEGERIVVSIENGDVSPYFVHAIVASEDPRFYENAGIDAFAIVRAFWQNLTAGEIESGASTITQQIVRDRILGTREVSLDRKFLEALISIEVANSYSKNEILDIYINEFFYGEQSYGVEAASQFYFDKPAADLNAAEAATLVGILPSPSNTNPVVDTQAAFNNMRVILDRMVEANCLNFQHGEWATQGVPFCVNENSLVDDGSGGRVPLYRRNPDGTFGGLLSVQIAQVETRRYEPRQSDIQYPHFVYYVLGQLDQAYGVGAYIERGFTVQTTLVPRIQNAAENALEQGVDRWGINGVVTGAAIVIDPQTGAILAMVGSPDFNDVENNGQNNNTISPQQPGSAIKPVVYATALSGTADGNYFTPASILWDVPSQYNIGGTNYAPTNFDRQNRGPVSVRHALAQSLNIPAVKTYIGFDTPAFISTANALGIDFEEDAVFGLPTAVGATEVSLMDLTQAYATIANDGLRNEPYVIQEISERGVNGTERPVELALSIAPAEAVQAITPQVAYLLQNIMSDDTARSQAVNGVGSTFPANSQISGQSFGLANINQVGAKTGTNNTENGNPSRIWTVGYTNTYAVGIWMGTLNQATPLTGNITGLTAASPYWNAIMRESLNGVNPGTFERPPGVVQDVVCRLTGTLDPADGSTCLNRVSEIFIQTQPPPSRDQGFVAAINIDSWTGLRANEWCPDYVVVETYSNVSDPFATSWLNSNPRGQQILTQLGLPTNLQAAPTGACQQGQTLPSVLINFPQENTVLEGQVAFTGQVSATDLQRWNLQISEVGTDNYRSIMPQPATNQIPSRGTVLFEWDSTSVENGAYIIRLEAISTSGGYIQRDVRVTIDNPLPTPIPASPTPVQVEITPLLPATNTPAAP